MTNLSRHFPARGELRIREHRFEWGTRTLLMGIVNVTPDSFSGDGLTSGAHVLGHALAQLERGADIIDVGGESTRPGHRPVDEATELARVVPAIAALRQRTGAVISVDTFKAEVLQRALDAGADLLNSICGVDGALLAAALERRIPIVIMHNKRVAVYERDVVEEVLEYLATSAARAVAAGIPREHVILDPGIGFGKTPEHNLALLRSLESLVALGFPTLVGTSRKSTIGKLTGRNVDERVFGTAATIALAIAAGVDIVRVHDVAQMRDVVRVSDAIVRGWRPHAWREELP